MPAKFVKSYQSPSGKVFPTLIEAQTEELLDLLNQITTVEDIPLDKRAGVCMALIEHKDQIVACLKQKERQRVRESKLKRGRPAKDKSATPAPAAA